MKKHYKLSSVEREQHDMAVKIRKMTDVQICEYIGQIHEESYNNGRNSMDAEYAAQDIERVNDFLLRLGELPERVTVSAPVQFINCGRLQRKKVI